MKCLGCRYAEIKEHGFKGFLGETIILCKICNEITGEMEECEDKILKRIDNLPKDVLDNATLDLQMFGVIFYDKCGKFHYDKFREECKETTKLLYNEEPHPKTKIRYQLVGFLSIVQTIVGIRNFTCFMSETKEQRINE